MRIERAETIPYALRFREPYVTARGRIDRREMALLRLVADDGTVGLGEAVPLSLRGDAPLADVVRELEDGSAGLIGLDVAADARWAGARLGAIEREAAIAPAARAALETALLDLAAKSAGVPLWRLLGAASARSIALNATLSAAEPASVARRAAEFAGRGFETMKLKLGIAAELDLAAVAAVRRSCGEAIRIRIDANEAWSTAEAERMLASLLPLGLELVEQPVAGLEAMAEVRRVSGARLAADEAVTDSASADRAVALEACDAATVKLSKVGGIWPALEIARRLPIYLSSALDGPVGIAAAAHVAATLPARFAHGLATLELFVESIGAGPRIEAGALRLTEAPGLGIELDEAALEAAAISPR